MLLALLAGCGGEDPKTISWDVSGGNEVSRVEFERPELTANELKPIESVRIRLPEGHVFAPEGVEIHDITLARHGDRLMHIMVDAEPLGVEDAYEVALEWAKQFELPLWPIEQWYRDGEKTTRTWEFGHRLGERGPTPLVQIRHWAGDDDKPAIVSMQFSWRVL